jgi:hypothetical protein
VEHRSDAHRMTTELALGDQLKLAVVAHLLNRRLGDA